MQEHENKERRDFPDAWERLIQKPEGGRKKVILYYTDVSMFFSHGEEMLDKIRDVLRVFYENREAVTLLWRQDRLLAPTLAVGKPKLWEEYLEILQEFEDQGYGIIDETVEEDNAYYEEIKEHFITPMPTPGERRAIDFCDAFYGDGGFIANICRNEGKPVMIENVEIRSEI